MEKGRGLVNEICYVLVGERRGDLWVGRLRELREGKPTSVAFDWDWVLAREERHGDVVGFFHTHPGGPPLPSTRDVRTMRAWVDCFGKPLLCVIESAGKLAGYVFSEESRLPVAQIARFRRGLLVAAG